MKALLSLVVIGSLAMVAGCKMQKPAEDAAPAAVQPVPADAAPAADAPAADAAAPAPAPEAAPAH